LFPNPVHVPTSVNSYAAGVQITSQQWAEAFDELHVSSFSYLERALQLAEVYFTACPSLPSNSAIPVEFVLKTSSASSSEGTHGVVSLCLVIVGEDWSYTTAAAKLVASIYHNIPEATSAAATYTNQDEKPLFLGDQFNTAFVYQAIKPSGKETEFKGKIPGMRTELRRFQVCELVFTDDS
jgi:hypothetical protein